MLRWTTVTVAVVGEGEDAFAVGGRRRCRGGACGRRGGGSSSRRCRRGRSGAGSAVGGVRPAGGLSGWPVGVARGVRGRGRGAGGARCSGRGTGRAGACSWGTWSRRGRRGEPAFAGSGGISRSCPWVCGWSGCAVLLRDAQQRQEVFERVASAAEAGGVDAAVVGERARRERRVRRSRRGRWRPRRRR